MLLTHLNILLLVGGSLAQSYYNPRPRQRTKRAAYFLDDDEAGNQLISLKINNDDGTLSSPIRTPTGGKGLANLVAISQDSVVVSENYIFVINAGSNELSMFSIDPKDPYHPKLLGKPQPTQGQTPVSVTYSPKLNTACVTNAGSTAGIVCYPVSDQGLGKGDSIRILPQTQLADPTPLPGPIGPLILTADVLFNPSSTALFVTFRSNGGLPGSIYAFPVNNGTVGRTPVRSQFPDIPITFSLNFLAEGDSKTLSDRRLIVTQALPNVTGAALLDVQYPSLKVTLRTKIPLQGEVATCWVAYDPRLSKSAYVIDGGLNRISIINPQTGGLEKSVFFTNGDQPVVAGSGGFDTKIDRQWLYHLTDDPNNPKIDVYKVQGPKGTDLKVAQQFDIYTEVGKLPNFMGFAIWPNTLEPVSR